jgi:hypothetical protein
MIYLQMIHYSLLQKINWNESDFHRKILLNELYPIWLAKYNDQLVSFPLKIKEYNNINSLKIVRIYLWKIKFLVYSKLALGKISESMIL